MKSNEVLAVGWEGDEFLMFHARPLLWTGILVALWWQVPSYRTFSEKLGNRHAVSAVADCG